MAQNCSMLCSPWATCSCEGLNWGSWALAQQYVLSSWSLWALPSSSSCCFLPLAQGSAQWSNIGSWGWAWGLQCREGVAGKCCSRRGAASQACIAAEGRGFMGVLCSRGEWSVYGFTRWVGYMVQRLVGRECLCVAWGWGRVGLGHPGAACEVCSLC